MRKLLLVFAAGCLGALVSSLVMWLFGRYGIPQSLGVSMAPGLSAHWLYPRIVWGGIWGFLFVLPFLGSSIIARSFILSLFPTLVQLFIIYPYQTNAGVAGLGLGLLTPAFVVLYNWIWALTAAIALRLARS